VISPTTTPARPVDLVRRFVPALDGPRVGRSRYPMMKRSIDCALAFAALILAAPVMLVAVLAIKCVSRGPCFYSQTRMGWDGKPFRIFKIRTMHHDCEKTSGVCWSGPGDARVVPGARVLRSLKVDELPQLWNVLRGDMSLVGPRPERPEFRFVLEQHIPRYGDRLLVPQGITGPAQIQLAADCDLEDVRRKLVLDLWYVENASLWLDIRILMGTALYMVGVPCRWLARLLGLPK